MDLLTFAAGIALLAFGGDKLVNAASRLARTMHVSPLTIGVLLLGLGTSLPELSTTVVAALRRQSDLAIGIPLAGQSSLDNTNLVGHCVNALPLRIAVDSKSTAQSLMLEAREKLLDAYDHQTFTYAQLKEASSRWAHPSVRRQAP